MSTLICFFIVCPYRLVFYGSQNNNSVFALNFKLVYLVSKYYSLSSQSKYYSLSSQSKYYSLSSLTKFRLAFYMFYKSAELETRF